MDEERLLVAEGVAVGVDVVGDGGLPLLDLVGHRGRELQVPKVLVLDVDVALGPLDRGKDGALDGEVAVGRELVAAVVDEAAAVEDGLAVEVAAVAEGPRDLDLVGPAQSSPSSTRSSWPPVKPSGAQPRPAVLPF